MRIGTQIIAADGCGTLMRGLVYYFLRSDFKSGRVFIVHFDNGNNIGQPKAHLLAVPRRAFEEGGGFGSNHAITSSNEPAALA